MTIYEHKTTQTAASGSVSSTTLTIPGGLLRSILVRANTSTTVFRFDVGDGVDTRLNYDYHEGEINETNVNLPVAGDYTCNITNASADDTFRVILTVQEN